MVYTMSEILDKEGKLWYAACCWQKSTGVCHAVFHVGTIDKIQEPMLHIKVSPMQSVLMMQHLSRILSCRPWSWCVQLPTI